MGKDNGELYKVEIFKICTEDGEILNRHYITKSSIPVYDINGFLEDMGLNKNGTSKTYAYSLVKYLNYLKINNRTYQDANTVTVKHFLTWQIYGSSDSLTIKSIGDQVTYSTLSGDISAIKGFYMYLNNAEIENDIKLSKERRRLNKNSFFYGQIMNYDYFKIIDKNIKSLKGSREYIKRYNDDDKKAILDNLNTLRDKAIFYLQLEGMRIDEVLSITLSSYNEFDGTVQPTRSKRKPDVNDGENEMRYILLPEEGRQVLDRYILTERAEIESASGKYSEWMFLNLQNGEYQGEVLTQANYRKILKQAARRAGFNPKKIRTHSGRSTKANELLEHQVKYPQDNMTDTVIKEIMGWESIASITPYKENNNKTIAQAVSEKILRRKK